MIFVDTFLLTFVLTLLMTPLARRASFVLGIYAVPTDRKMHNQLMPEFGGLAIFISLSAALLLLPLFPSAELLSVSRGQLFKIWIAILLVFVMGAVDDKYNIPAFFKLLIQLLVAYFLVQSGMVIHYLTNPFTGDITSLGSMSVIISMGWITVLMNAINLIDGLDGLASGVTAISSFFLFIIALIKGELLPAFLLVALLGTAIGFIKYNKWPASIFMGDSGAMQLGLLMAVASIEGVLKSSLTVALLIPLLSLLIPLYDLLFSIVRRLRKGEHIFKPDRGHVHHRLLSIGYNHSQAVVRICLVTFFFNVVALLMAVVNNVLIPFIFLIAAVSLLFFINYKLQVKEY